MIPGQRSWGINWWTMSIVWTCENRNRATWEFFLCTQIFSVNSIVLWNLFTNYKSSTVAYMYYVPPSQYSCILLHVFDLHGDGIGHTHGKKDSCNHTIAYSSNYIFHCWNMSTDFYNCIQMVQQLLRCLPHPALLSKLCMDKIGHIRNNRKTQVVNTIHTLRSLIRQLSSSFLTWVSYALIFCHGVNCCAIFGDFRLLTTDRLEK